MNSHPFTIDKDDLYKILKGAAIAMAGALLTYLSSVITNTNFGEMTPVVTAAWSILVNFARKFLAGNKMPTEKTE